ncbi:MAG: (2Fe-2S)-binding protein [Marinicella sp.]
MYVCICHGVTEKDIQKAAKSGAADLQDIQNITGCATGCGTCAESAIEVLQAAHAKKTPDFLNILKPSPQWQIRSQDQAPA